MKGFLNDTQSFSFMTYPMVLIIYLGSVMMSACLLLAMSFGHSIHAHYHASLAMPLSILVFLYLVMTGILLYYDFRRLAAWSLILFYLSGATLIVCIWGINLPVGILMLAFVIALAGVLAGSEYIIPMTIVVSCVLIAVQILTDIGVIRPEMAALAYNANYSDIAADGTLFAIFAIVMWLSKLRTEYALKRALAAEEALLEERAMLAQRLEERTRSLRNAQLEEMRQLYRISELGQTSTTLLHELANDLAVITLDIDALEQRNHSSSSVRRAKQSIARLDRKMSRLRRQLKVNTSPQRFAVDTVVREAVDYLKHRADMMHVPLLLHPTGVTAYIRGDPQKLCQAIIILANNAIEASVIQSTIEPVTLEIDSRHDDIEIIITDKGPGIPVLQRQRLFKPFTSTKKNGMGIGLFIAKQIIEVHLKGSLSLDLSLHPTIFRIRIPKDHSRAGV